MYNKINNTDGLALLKAGSMLIKYPAIGEPEDTMDLSDESKRMSYEVYSINGEELELKIPQSEISSATQPLSVPHMNGRSSASVLVKNVSALIEESVWWVEVK